MEPHSQNEEEEWDIDQYFLPGGILDPDSSERSTGRSAGFRFGSVRTTSGGVRHESVLPNLPNYASHHETLSLPAPESLPLPLNPWNASSSSAVPIVPAAEDDILGNINGLEGDKTTSYTTNSSSLLGELESGDTAHSSWKQTLLSKPKVDNGNVFRPRQLVRPGNEAVPQRTTIVPPPGFETPKIPDVAQQWITPQSSPVDPRNVSRRKEEEPLHKKETAKRRNRHDTKRLPSRRKENRSIATHTEVEPMDEPKSPVANQCENDVKEHSLEGELNCIPVEATTPIRVAESDTEDLLIHQHSISANMVVSPLSYGERLESDTPEKVPASRNSVDSNQVNEGNGIDSAHALPGHETTTPTKATMSNEIHTNKHQSVRRRGRKSNVEHVDESSSTHAVDTEPVQVPIPPSDTPSTADHQQRPHTELEPVWLASNATPVGLWSLISGFGARIFHAVTDAAIVSTCKQSTRRIYNAILRPWRYAYVGLLACANILVLGAEEASIGHWIHDLLDPIAINLRINVPHSSSSLLCYVGLGLLPVASDWMMQHADFPHFTPHIVAHIAMYYLSSLDRRPSDVELALSPRRKLPVGTVGGSVSSGGVNHFLNQPYCLDGDRLKLSYTLSFWILRSVRFYLPLNFILDGFSNRNSNFMMMTSSARLVLAYILSLTKKSLLLSPVAWIAWSLQVLVSTYANDGYLLNGVLFVFGMAAVRLVETIQGAVEK